VKSQQQVTVGQWLFRWRSYLPLAFVVLIVPAVLVYTPPFLSDAAVLVWELSCFLISMLGLAIRCYTVGFVPEGTSGRNTDTQIANSLNTDGMYSIVRNPLYLGNYVMILGVMMFFGLWWVPVVYTIVFWWYYRLIVAAEEAFLQATYGAEYQDYTRRVPAFIPKPGNWKAASLSFSFRTVLRREYSGFFGVIAAFTIVEVATKSVFHNHLSASPVWIAVFCTGVIVYVTLRTLKKKSRVLHVYGR